MQWQEVRQLYPDRFAKMHILKSHIKDQTLYVEEVAVLKAYDDDLTATRELVRTKDPELVYHTSKETIEIAIKPMFGFRRSYDFNLKDTVVKRILKKHPNNSKRVSAKSAETLTALSAVERTRTSTEY
ncbi:hypothetical protein [Paenibacillus sp. YN15]|uniref:hypothetical protein n=1 Tax=Paenibacillus sp. YN15 TaxID=1742774 RepID=UPI0015EC5247|nr:hypothetical protein [Paenibacillus sp. YN15]